MNTKLKDSGPCTDKCRPSETKPTRPEEREGDEHAIQIREKIVAWVQKFISDGDILESL